MPFLDTTSTATSSGPFSGVSDFFSSGYFTAFVRVVALFAIAMWLALAFWTAKDARRRIDDPVIVAVCVAAAVLFGPLGVIIYLMLRPPEYLEDVRERELEIQAMSAGWVPTRCARTAATRRIPASSPARTAAPS